MAGEGAAGCRLGAGWGEPRRAGAVSSFFWSAHALHARTSRQQGNAVRCHSMLRLLQSRYCPLALSTRLPAPAFPCHHRRSLPQRCAHLHRLPGPQRQDLEAAQPGSRVRGAGRLAWPQRGQSMGCSRPSRGGPWLQAAGGEPNLRELEPGPRRTNYWGRRAQPPPREPTRRLLCHADCSPPGAPTCRLTLRGHKRGVWAVAFSPVDQVVATASGDKTIR